MSANVPYEIQEDIVKRVVHVKSLIRFRSVSKQWKSLIDSPKFIAHHILNQTRPHHLLVTYEEGSEIRYVSVADDDSFPRNMFNHTLPLIFEQYRSYSSIINCSHGLVCLLFYRIESYPSRKNLLVIWNPSIRKYVGINMPDTFFSFGFGVCPKTGDPKIVQISEDWKAKVFSLSSRAWRSVPLKVYSSQRFISIRKVELDGVIYWTFYDNNDDLRVISFDVTSEEFGEEVEIPKSPKGYYATSIYKLNECMVVLYYPTPWVAGRRDCYGWKMLKNGASVSSFTKLFKLNVSHSSGSDRLVGFRKNGQPIIERKLFIVDDHIFKENGQAKSERYDESILEFHDQQGSVEGYIKFGNRGSQIWMTSYMESLLLFKHADCIIE